MTPMQKVRKLQQARETLQEVRSSFSEPMHDLLDIAIADITHAIILVCTEAGLPITDGNERDTS